jgi:anti-sigma factor RsiW
MNSESQHELDWLAFQYALDELSPRDRAAFEVRLEDDQNAREAVARAVELSLATCAAYREDAVVLAARERMLGKSSRGWWSVGVAACALFALIAVSQLTRNAGERLARTTPKSNGDQLAIAWSQTRAALPTSAVLGEDLDTLDDDFAIRGDDDTLVALPSWMIAAVAEVDMNSGMNNGMDMTSPEQGDKSTTIE